MFFLLQDERAQVDLLEKELMVLESEQKQIQLKPQKDQIKNGTPESNKMQDENDEELPEPSIEQIQNEIPRLIRLCA